MAGARRGRVRVVFQDANGVVQVKSLRLAQPGTSTAIASAIYNAVQGGATVANPRNTDAEGTLVGYIDRPQRLDIYNVTDAATEIANQAVYPDPEFFVDAFNDVGFHGAVGDGITNDTVAIQAAIDYIGARGGGPVLLSANRSYLLSSRLVIGYPNTWLQGPTVSDDDYNPRTFLNVGFTAMPAIVIGGDQTVAAGAGSYSGVKDLTIQHSVTPVQGEYDSNLASSTILVNRCGGNTANGRAYVQRVRIIGAVDCVQIGTSGVHKGAGAVTIDDCPDLIFSRDCVRVYGSNYLYFRRNEGESYPERNGGAVVRFVGTGTSQPDGGEILGNFFEDISYGVWGQPTLGSVGNFLIHDNLFDGIGSAGVYMQPLGAGPNGTLNRWSIKDNRINGANLSSTEWGVLIDQSAASGEVYEAVIDDNEIADMGGPAIEVITPSAGTRVRELVIKNNKIFSCTRQASVPAIRLGNNLQEFTIDGNIVSSARQATKSSYVVAFGSGCSQFKVVNNVGIDMATGIISAGTAPNSTTKVVKNNYGDKRAAEPFVLAVFYKDTPGNNYAATDMVRTGATAESRITLPFACRLVAITANTTAALASGGTATCQATVDGSIVGLTLTCTGDGSDTSFLTDSTDGIEVAAGSVAGIKLSTNGSFGVNNITVNLWAVWNEGR